MACKFSPEELRKHYDEAGSKPISREGHLNFRDDLIRLLHRLKTKTISGTISVTNLAVGSSVDFSVDHSSDASFCFCEYPQFTVLNGVDVLIFALIDVDGTGRATTGSRFSGRITNVSIGGTGTGTFNLSWTRTGMV